MTQEKLVAGIVGAPRGLRGEVSVILRTDLPEERFEPGTTLTTNRPEWPALTVESLGYHRDRAYLTFAEITTREEAEALKGAELLVDPDLEEEDAWYAHELIGLRVLDSEERKLGVVTGLQVGLAQDLLEVEANGQTVLVPLVIELVPEVDPAAGIVRVTPPDGLFPGSTN